jgi:hypothetical protein
MSEYKAVLLLSRVFDLLFSRHHRWNRRHPLDEKVVSGVSVSRRRRGSRGSTCLIILGSSLVHSVFSRAADPKSRVSSRFFPLVSSIRTCSVVESLI